MRIWTALRLLFGVWVAVEVRCSQDALCPRLAPPPGVLVLAPGSEVILGCRGDVTVDGTLLATAAGTYQRGISGDTGDPTATVRYQRETGEPTVFGTYQRDIRGDKGNELTWTSRQGDTAATGNSMNGMEEEHRGRRRGLESVEDSGDRGALTVTVETGVATVVTDEEVETRSKVTRGRARWSLNGQPVQRGRERGGALRLPELRLADAGNYSCHRAGRLISTVTVSVGVPPGRSSLSCFRRSPTSKIHCDWTASQPVIPPPQCYLLLKKEGKNVSRVACVYLERGSQCVCVLGRGVEGDRRLHEATLCVTNAAGNTTSPLIRFIPYDIIKPDPPARVQVGGGEGLEHTLGVSWAYPSSWRRPDYYCLKFQLRYRPLQGQEYQVVETEGLWWRIVDVMPHTQYELQLRGKDLYEGHWSDWSKPAYAHTWTAPESTTVPGLYTSLDSLWFYPEGSGIADEDRDTGVEVENDGVMWVHVFWVFGCCVLLSLILLSVYGFRHRVRFMSKLEKRCWTPPPRVRPPPPRPSPPSQQPGDEAKPLVPPLSLTPPQDTPHHFLQGEEVAQEGIHLHNMGYFLVQN